VKYLLSSVVTLALVMCNSYIAFAQTEVTLLAPRPVQPELEKLIAAFEKSANYKVKATWGSGLGTKEQVARGEAADVSVMFAPFPEALASGNIVPGSGKTLARLILGLAVRKGAPRPDISTPDAVKRTLLAARVLSPVTETQALPLEPASKPWLQGRWLSGANYDKDPRARVSFGLYGAQPRNYIFFRENY